MLGYDESPSANAALAKTVELATALGGSVVVVFGYYISPLGGGDVADFKAQLEKVGSHAVSGPSQISRQPESRRLLGSCRRSPRTRSSRSQMRSARH